MLYCKVIVNFVFTSSFQQGRSITHVNVSHSNKRGSAIHTQHMQFANITDIEQQTVTCSVYIILSVCVCAHAMNATYCDCIPRPLSHKLNNYEAQSALSSCNKPAYISSVLAAQHK
jgi:hypothetical protein